MSVAHMMKIHLNGLKNSNPSTHWQYLNLGQMQVFLPKLLVMSTKQQSAG